VSLNTLDHHIVEWLHRKGFHTAEDIRELQDACQTDSLIKACFMLMVLVPRLDKGIDRKILGVRTKRWDRSTSQRIPEEIRKAVRQLFQKKLDILLDKDPAQPRIGNRLDLVSYV
jgi:hypothetical protein